jgi:hypothetical protein
VYFRTKRLTAPSRSRFGRARPAMPLIALQDYKV